MLSFRVLSVKVLPARAFIWLLTNQQGPLTDVCSLPVSFGGILMRLELYTSWCFPRAQLRSVEYSLFLGIYWLFSQWLRLPNYGVCLEMLWTGCKPEVGLIHKSVCVITWVEWWVSGGVVDIMCDGRSHMSPCFCVGAVRLVVGTYLINSSQLQKVAVFLFIQLFETK